jgi:hypothetical protein
VGCSPPETASRRGGRPSSSRQDRPPSRIDTRGSAGIGPRLDPVSDTRYGPGYTKRPEIRRFCGVGATAFEPASFRPPAECVSRLRHAPSRFALADVAIWPSERPIAQSLDGPSMRPGCDLERRQRCRTSHRVAIHSIACRGPNTTVCRRFHIIAYSRRAPRAGLEPATRGLEGRRSFQLSYRGECL